jgi:hypothetical protein
MEPMVPADTRRSHFRFRSETEQTGFLLLLYFFVMAATRKPDPELLPIHRPRCPNCQTRMIAVAIASGPEGFEHRTFECRKCGHCETDVVANDPLKPDAAGWTAGELGWPQ